MNSIEKKIIKLGEALQKPGEKVVLCHGHFNIIHPGHIRYLDFSSQQGTKLVVSVLGDNYFLYSEQKQHFMEEERAAGVASIQIVDQVIMLGDGTLEELIPLLRPDILVLGKEFESEQHLQVSETIRLLKRQGGIALFHAGETRYASSELLRHNVPAQS